MLHNVSIRLTRRNLPETYARTYFTAASVTNEKSFIILTPEMLTPSIGTPERLGVAGTDDGTLGCSKIKGWEYFSIFKTSTRRPFSSV